MNPLEPNDPLWKLLGHARKIEVRGNFVQDVVRAARSEVQERGLWQRCKALLSGTGSAAWLRPALGAAAVAVAALALWEPAVTPVDKTVVVQAQAPTAVEDADMLQLAESLPTLPLETVNQMDALLALDDTQSLTDKEIAFLLY